MIPALVVTALVLLVVGLLAAAEWRFDRRTSAQDAAVQRALGKLRVHPRTSHLRLRVEIAPGELGQVEGRRVAATSQIERAWRPWGSPRYLITLHREAEPHAMVIWEAVVRCLRHDEAGSFGPAIIQDTSDYGSLLKELLS